MAYQVGRCLLRELLLKNGMSQAELAGKLNVTPQQVQHYVQSNRTMSLKVAKNISEILNCEMDELYEWYEVGSQK